MVKHCTEVLTEGRVLGRHFHGEEEAFCGRWRWHLRLESCWHKVWAGGVWVEGILAGGSAAGRKCGENIRSGGREGGRSTLSRVWISARPGMPGKGSANTLTGTEKR